MSSPQELASNDRSTQQEHRGLVPSTKKQKITIVDKLPKDLIAELHAASSPKMLIELTQNIEGDEECEYIVKIYMKRYFKVYIEFGIECSETKGIRMLSNPDHHEDYRNYSDVTEIPVKLMRDSIEWLKLGIGTEIIPGLCMDGKHIRLWNLTSDLWYVFSLRNFDESSVTKFKSSVIQMINKTLEEGLRLFGPEWTMNNK